MADIVLRAARASDSSYRGFVWNRIGPYIAPLFGKPTPPSLNSIIIIASFHVSWCKLDEDAVTRWAEVVSAVPYTEGVGWYAFGTLLEIASIESLRPHIPLGVWALLKKWPSTSCYCRDPSNENVVRHVRTLGDVEILKSYLLLVWSEQNSIDDGSRSLAEMERVIQEEFGGIGMGCHREGLAKQLDRILWQLTPRPKRRNFFARMFRSPSPDHPDPEKLKRKNVYGQLKEVLLEVDGEAVKKLTRKSLRSIFFCLLTPTGTYRIPFNLHVRSTSPMSVISLSESVLPFPLTTNFVRTSVPIITTAFPYTLPVAFVWPKFT